MSINASQLIKFVYIFCNYHPPRALSLPTCTYSMSTQSNYYCANNSRSTDYQSESDSDIAYTGMPDYRCEIDLVLLIELNPRYERFHFDT